MFVIGLAKKKGAHPCVLVRSHAAQLAGLQTRKQPAASVSAVTLRFHPQLWSCFSAQDWPEKELILIESTKATSKRTENESGRRRSLCGRY